MNKFLVGCQGEDIVILAFGRKMTKEDAINLAAWLVALSDFSEDHADFGKALEEVEAS